MCPDRVNVKVPALLLGNVYGAATPDLCQIHFAGLSLYLLVEADAACRRG